MSLFKFLLAFALIFSSAQSQSVTTCDNVVDIVFVLDYSGSLLTPQFESHRMLIRLIAAMFDLDNKLVARVGFLLYHNVVNEQFAVGAYTNKADALTKIMAAQLPGQQSSTATAMALDSAWQALLNAKNNDMRTPQQAQGLKRIIMLFSDGVPTHDDNANHPCSPFHPTGNGCTAMVESQAARIKEGTYSGDRLNVNPVQNSQLGPVNIFVGFVNNANTASNKPHLENIASSPTAEWFRDFSMGLPTQTNQIAPIAMEIVAEICMTQAPTPTPTTVIGDIHLQTLDGVMYTFNGAGDYVYLTAEGKVCMHVRAAMVGKATTLAALALRDENSKDTLELWWNGIGADSLHVNLRQNGEKKNREVDIREDAVKVGPFSVWRNEMNRQIFLQHSKWNNFNITANYGGRASFATIVPQDWKTAGLGGNNNGVKEDDICGRKGNCVSMKATNRDVHEKALDWKVLPDELIFEKWMPVNDWELRYHPLEMTYEQLLKAKQLCGDIQQCIFDYISVGRKEYALLTRKDFLAYQKENKNYVYVGDRL